VSGGGGGTTVAPVPAHLRWPRAPRPGRCGARPNPAHLVWHSNGATFPPLAGQLVWRRLGGGANLSPAGDRLAAGRRKAALDTAARPPDSSPLAGRPSRSILVTLVAPRRRLRLGGSKLRPRLRARVGVPLARVGVRAELRVRERGPRVRRRPRRGGGPAGGAKSALRLVRRRRLIAPPARGRAPIETAPN